MVYQKRYRRRYSRASVSIYKNYMPIANDLKKYFFQANSVTLKALFLNYKEEYGDSAYRYALKSYPNWRNGETELSSQTLLRIIKTLPQFLTVSERIKLLEKLLEHQKRAFVINDFEKLTATWDNYPHVIYCLSEKIRFMLPKKFKPLDIPVNITNEVKWLCANDMLLAKRIYNEFQSKMFKQEIENAINDLYLFKRNCDLMKAKGAVYDNCSIVLNLSTAHYELNIIKKEKTLKQKLVSFFR